MQINTKIYPGTPSEQWKIKERKDTGKIMRCYPNIIFIYLINLMLLLMPANERRKSRMERASIQGKRKSELIIKMKLWLNKVKAREKWGCRVQRNHKSMNFLWSLNGKKNNKSRRNSWALMIASVVIFLIKIYHLASSPGLDSIIVKSLCEFKVMLRSTWANMKWNLPGLISKCSPLLSCLARARIKSMRSTFYEANEWW